MRQTYQLLSSYTMKVKAEGERQPNKTLINFGVFHCYYVIGFMAGGVLEYTIGINNYAGYNGYAFKLTLREGVISCVTKEPSIGHPAKPKVC